MTTFQILSAAGFLMLFVTLLYLWADIRELKKIAKENRRELLRGSFGERTARTVQPFPPEEKAVQTGNGQAAGREHLKAAEEQILQEVLTEFLG